MDGCEDYMIYITRMPEVQKTICYLPASLWLPPVTHPSWRSSRRVLKSCCLSTQLMSMCMPSLSSRSSMAREAEVAVFTDLCAAVKVTKLRRLSFLTVSQTRVVFLFKFPTITKTRTRTNGGWRHDTYILSGFFGNWKWGSNC